MQANSKKNDGSIVVPIDLADESVNDFTEQLTSLIGGSPQEIFLDCSRLKWVTSKHVNLLWQAHNQCQDSGIRARLVNTSEKLIRVLKILDIYDLLTCEPAQATTRIQVNSPSTHAETRPAWQIGFGPEATEIKIALERFQNYLTSLNVSDLFTFEIETVFYEIATNIRLHSEISDDERILLRCLPDSDKLHMEFEYRGVRFDPTDSGLDFDVMVAAQNGQKRGYGLLMINRMTDGIKYNQKDNNCNVLTLEKFWR